MPAYLKDMIATVGGLCLMGVGRSVSAGIDGFWLGFAASAVFGVPGLIMIRYAAQKWGAW